MPTPLSNDLRAIAERVSCSAICDALMRRRDHRAHLIDLASPAPERWLLAPAVTMHAGLRRGGRSRNRGLVRGRERPEGRPPDHALRGRPAGVRGGVTVAPGDWVYADAAGAVVIPPADLEPVLEEALRIEERDAAAVARMRERDRAFMQRLGAE